MDSAPESRGPSSVRGSGGEVTPDGASAKAAPRVCSGEGVPEVENPGNKVSTGKEGGILSPAEGEVPLKGTGVQGWCTVEVLA